MEKSITEWFKDRGFTIELYRSLMGPAKSQVLRLQPNIHRGQDFEDAAQECVHYAITAVIEKFENGLGRKNEQITAQALQLEVRKFATKKQFGPCSVLTRRWFERLQKEQKIANKREDSEDDLQWWRGEDDPDGKTGAILKSTAVDPETAITTHDLLRKFAQHSAENKSYCDVINAYYFPPEGSAKIISEDELYMALKALKAFTGKIGLMDTDESSSLSRVHVKRNS